MFMWASTLAFAGRRLASRGRTVFSCYTSVEHVFLSDRLGRTVSRQKTLWIAPTRRVKGSTSGVTYGIMCQAGKGYSLWLCNSHEQEHPDATAYCND